MSQTLQPPRLRLFLHALLTSVAAASAEMLLLHFAPYYTMLWLLLLPMVVVVIAVWGVPKKVVVRQLQWSNRKLDTDEVEEAAPAQFHPSPLVEHPPAPRHANWNV